MKEITIKLTDDEYQQYVKRIIDYIVFATNGALDEEKSKRLNKL
jgi:hypothetical protein